MPATSNKALSLAADPTVGEAIVQQVLSQRVGTFEFFESIRDGISRGSLFSAMLAVAGPREGKARGYLTESVDISGAAGEFSLVSRDGARFDEEGYVAGLCPWRAESSTVLEQHAAMFSVEHTDSTLQSLPFANTGSTDYYVGITCATYPTNAESNPRTSVVSYTTEKTVIGLKVRPAAVTDLGGGQIKLDLGTDSLLGTHSLAGRTAVVYLVDPVTSTPTAVPSATITFASSTNSVTVGYLGQPTPSTTASDYEIVILGPVCTNNAGVLNTDGYAHVGVLTGVTYAVDTDAQDVIPTMLGFLRDVVSVSRPSSNTARQNAFKIDVRAKAGELGVSQLTVRNTSATKVFTVNEAGEITGLSLSVSAAVATATLTASGLITANGGIATETIALTGAGAHLTMSSGNLVTEWDEATNRYLEVRNVGLGFSGVRAGELVAETANGGTGKVIANIYERSADWDRTERASALKHFGQWVYDAQGGGTFSYNNGGGTPPYAFVAATASGVQTFRHVLDLNPEDHIVTIGAYAYRASGSASLTVALRTWEMTGVAPSTTHVTHTQTGATGSWVDDNTSLGSPVLFPGGVNDRYVLECVLTNDGASPDTVRLAYLYVVIRRALGADIAKEIKIGG